MSTPTTLSFLVPAMTCGHCVASVREEIGAVDGVTAVEVDLDSKRVVVTGSDFSDDAIWEAVVEAGYEAVPG
jgi:copper chaperone